MVVDMFHKNSMHLMNNGIARQITNSYTSKRNGVLKKINRNLVESACSMLKHVSFPNSLWGEAIAICYVQNQFPIKVVLQNNPYELWHGAKPNVRHLHIFGCDIHIHMPEELRQKLNSNSQENIFIGYNHGMKGYKFYDLQNKKLLASHDVNI